MVTTDKTVAKRKNEMDKAVGTDELGEQSIYPALLGPETSRYFAKNLRDEALQEFEVFDKEADPLSVLAGYKICTKIIFKHLKGYNSVEAIRKNQFLR